MQAVTKAMKTKRLVIVGDSAFAEVAREYFDSDTDYQVAAFSVESEYLKRDRLHGLPVVSFETLEAAYPPAEYDVFVAVVYTQLNRLRTRLAHAAKQKGYRLASYVSPRAFVWRNVVLGEHCFVFEDNTLQPFVRLGNNVVLWSGNHIGHHSTVHDNCFISSHAVISGFCEIGENTFVGVNSTVANNVKIASDNWIGPGTVILKDTERGNLFRTEQPEPARVSALRFFKVPQ
jgi:sugar O-acyltransferase (sialic acid O-acetyltransferase NeuD family)